MISVTDRAAEKIIDLLVATKNPAARIRVYVQGGGCAGLNYGFKMEEDFSEDDFMIDTSTYCKLVVDSTSAQYLAGSTVDYKEELMSSQFVVDNPNAEVSCGCGSSFAPKPITP